MYNYISNSIFLFHFQNIALFFLPKDIDVPELNSSYKSLWLSIADRLSGICSTVDVSLPHFKYGVPCYNIINSAEAASNMAKYSGLVFGESVSHVGLLTTTHNQSIVDTGALMDIDRVHTTISVSYLNSFTRLTINSLKWIFYEIFCTKYSIWLLNRCHLEHPEIKKTLYVNFCIQP